MKARVFFIVFCSLVMSGCQSTAENQAHTTPQLLDDTLFPSHHFYAVETAEAVFYLDEDAKRFAERAVLEKSISEKNVKGLVKAIFDRSENGMQYLNTANTVANTTFNNRTANCLSLSIMTYALAEHAGLDATFYEVKIPEYWTRQSGYSMLNGHINLRVSIPDDPLITSVGARWADVDFDPQMLRDQFPRQSVAKNTVLSMFYNNKGADALVANSYTKAYSYFKAAATADPQHQQSWVNLGVLYRMVDAYQQSERAYKHALSLDDNNLTAWENLSILYVYQDRHEEAATIKDMVETRRRNNPFYHFILGEQALEEGNAALALVHYQKGLRLDNTRHEILFGVAKAYHELGDVSKVQAYLERALRHSSNEQEKQRYASKVASLARNVE